MASQPAPGYQRGDLRGSALRSEVLRVLEAALRRRIGEGENPSRSSEAAWDSLKHVELVFLIEDHFEVRFSEKQMAEMEDAANIVKILEGKLAAQPGD